jgi:hypothetical protein
MGFFSSIKNKLGIGGVKVVLEVPGQVEKSKNSFDGKVILTTKSDQYITDLTVKLIEKYTTGRGEEKKTKEYELGVVKTPCNFDIKTGETKEIPFTLNFQILKSGNDELKEKGGVMGGIGKLGAFANNEKSEYSVIATADVKSAALDPNDIKDIKLV